MNRTQRAMKKHLRKLENGRQSFKRIYLNGSKAFASSTDSERIKALQKELKAARRKTRNAKLVFAEYAPEDETGIVDFSDSNRTSFAKEDIEV